MKNLKVGKKLVISFGIVLAMFIVSVIVVLVSLNGIKTQLNQFYNVPWQTRGAAQDLAANLAEQQKSLFRAVATTDEKIITPALADVERYGQKIQADINVLYAKVLSANKGVVDDLAGKIAEWDKVKNTVLEMAKDSSISSNDISAYIQENNLSIVGEVEASLAQTVETANNTGEQLIADTNQAQSVTTVLLVAMCLISVLTGIFLCSYNTKSITGPIKEIERAANQMAEGNLKVTIGYTSKDELGNLSNSMRTMMQRNSFYMQELTGGMQQLAAGDLNVAAREAFLGDFRPVQLAIRSLVQTLNQTLTQINEASGQVAGSADQVSSGAQALSQGATEQASSVEELAATISEISSQTAVNAQSAQTVKSTVDQVSGKLLESNQHMQEMNRAMQEISASSQEIGKIIKTIEDIAFQTNILALNAAVEAARAGVAGKGFSVVADEVRSLASKSSEASKSTSELIERSLNAVRNGTSIADQTAVSLSEVVVGTKKIEEQIGQIVHASVEQANSTMQITQGIDQISSVVQTNSATAEESAAASEELTSQAQMLKNLIAQFRLKGGNGLPETKRLNTH